MVSIPTKKSNNSQMDLPFSVLLQVARILEERAISYVLVGSLASSMHGMYRSTADIDILADVKPEQVRPLLEALQESFYVDEHAMREVLTQRSSFNVIHLDSVFKVDIFLPKTDEFAWAQLERRQLRRISADTKDAVYVATAEDTVLAKLRWYRLGNEVSDTQWNDVVGIIGASGESLDQDYMRFWAAKLELADLLEKALAEPH
jgi:predicted nucleotidyltransferase